MVLDHRTAFVVFLLLEGVNAPAKDEKADANEYNKLSSQDQDYKMRPSLTHYDNSIHTHQLTLIMTLIIYNLWCLDLFLANCYH